LKLEPGQWAFWPIDKPMHGCRVFTGSFNRRVAVGELTKHQQMAYWRHSGQRGLYHSFKQASGKWIDVRLIGDVDAALDYESDHEEHKYE
jgi:hypothetical protein